MPAPYYRESWPEQKTVPITTDLLQTLWTKQANAQRTITGLDGSVNAIKATLRIDQ